MWKASRVRVSHSLSGSWLRASLTRAKISPAAVCARDHSRAKVPS